MRRASPAALIGPTLAALLAVAGCDKADKGTSVTITGENGNALAAVSGESGEVKIDTPGFKGSFTLPKIQLDADSFDLNGVKLPPGSRVTGMNIDGKDDAGAMRIGFDSPVAPEALRDWFRERLPKAGYTVEASGTGLSGVTDDKRAFHLEVAPAAGGHTSGTISIGG